MRFIREHDVHYVLTNGTDGFVKYGLQTLLCQSGTLQVFDSPYVSSHGNTLAVLNGLHTADGVLSMGNGRCQDVLKY